mmetsp:Transcript_25097/g.59265  ORF Transcript_25097/g.59265 Transcript_25097/m.59265 type:complete len:106 (+) Transcript_25097:389-706(+)
MGSTAGDASSSSSLDDELDDSESVSLSRAMLRRRDTDADRMTPITSTDLLVRPVSLRGVSASLLGVVSAPRVRDVAVDGTSEMLDLAAKSHGTGAALAAVPEQTL